MIGYRWISAAQRPPEEGAACIVRWGAGFASEAVYRGGRFTYVSGVPIEVDITHWIPWPKGPAMFCPLRAGV